MSLSRSFASIFKNRDSGAMKITLLGVGLAMAFVLIAKVYFENTYENFFPDVDRIYRVLPIYEIDGKIDDYESTSTSGGIAPALQEYSPLIETVTRGTNLISSTILKYSDVAYEDAKPTECKRIACADSSFFEIFATNTVGDDVKEILSSPSGVLMSRSLANKMSKTNDAESMIGKTVVSEDYPDLEMNVRGIFDDFPNNSEFRNTELIASILIMGKGASNMVGNDRYTSFIRLRTNADANQLKESIERMCLERIDPVLKEYNETNIKIRYALAPLASHHSNSNEVKRMTSLLLILAFSVLFVAMLNYVLIAITALVKKARNIAVHKCYGASQWQIYKIMLSEALAALTLSLLLSFVLILSFRQQIEFLTNTTLWSLFTPRAISIFVLVSALVLVICGLIPAFIYSRVPVSVAFRRYKETQSHWKKSLLLIQFSGTIFFVSMITIVGIQYNHLINLNVGYNYEDLLSVNINGIDSKTQELLKTEISRLKHVEKTSLSAVTPLTSGSGNNVYLPNTKGISFDVSFNVCDQYSVDEDFIPLMEIQITEGNNFDARNTDRNQILVSKRFIPAINKHVDWSDGVIGKKIHVTEHSNSNKELFTIIGVFEDYMIGNATRNETRPLIIFRNNDSYTSYYDYLLIKTTEENAEVIKTINNRLTELVPNRIIEAESYTDSFVESYVESRKFRNLIVTSGFIVLIIAFIGLIGYMRDEVARRRSEIAIRKIHGALTSEIITRFAKSILLILSFGTVAGISGSYFAADRWLEQFSQKIELSWWTFSACTMVVITTVMAVIALTTYKAANANPVENIKNE